MKNKSICIFVHCFPPAKGGLEYLIEETKKILDEKYTVHIITGKGSTLDSYKTFKDFLPNNKTDKKNNIHRLKLNFFWQRIANKFLNKIILKVGFFSPFYFGPILEYTPKIINIIKNSNIIIGTGMPTKMFYDSYIFAKKFNQKLILIPAYHNVNYYNNCPFFQKSLNYSHKILYLSPMEKLQLIKNYKINKSKLIQTTFCPYTIKQIKKQQTNLNKIISKKLKRIHNKQINIGFIGQITLRKNLIIFKNYLDKYLLYWQKQNYKLTLYFSGAKTNSSSLIEKEFKKYIKQNIVKINYNFKKSEKQRKFEKIDIFINPSIEESLGIVNFEAIYHGIPLIINRNSAFSQITQNNNIYTYDNIEDINKILKDLINKPDRIRSIINIQNNLLEKYNFDIFK
ncbi:glycosyltransferase, partial [Patescibacteria group bacterium]|nr:glycosyltransferase [Patescibacteria group bacterium]